MLKKILALSLIFIPAAARADENMARYIIDGRFVIYAVSVQETSSVVRQFFQKFMGAEGSKSLSAWQSSLRARMGVNPIDPVETATIGIDPLGSVAYVHLGEGRGYLIFTVKNKDLLAYTLDNLPQPPAYRILEGRYVIFSVSLDILDYTEFRGLPALPEFQTVAKALGFNWTQNFFWISGSYLREKSTINPGQYVFPDGDRIGIVFNMDAEKVTFDAYTVYKDPAVREALKKSMNPAGDQRLSLLDYEAGRPAVTGQLYLHLPSYIDAMVMIDRSEELGLRRLFASLEKNDIDLKNRLFPYLRGRISYIIRAYEPLKNIYDATFMAGISDETRVKEFLSILTASAGRAGKKIGRKTLFTRDFYGIPLKGSTLWLGVVEGNLVVSTSETDVNALVKNIYENNGGFLDKLPPAFSRAVRGRVYGGQHYIYVPQFIQWVKPNLLPALSGLLLPFETIEWYYYLQETDGQPGRRDTVTGHFFRNKRQQ